MHNDKDINTINQTVEQATETKTQLSSGRIILLQLLTYTSWTITIFLISGLSGIVFSYLFNFGITDPSIIYIIAGTVAILSFAIFIDTRYQLYEPAEKLGGASLLMVFNAALYIAIIIGTLGVIVSILIGISMNGERLNDLSSISVPLVILALSSVVLIRTLYSHRINNIRTLLIVLMPLLLTMVSVIIFIGPLQREKATRNDRLIETNLYEITNTINNYARKNDRLPDTLQDLEFNGEAQSLVSTNQVVYTPNTLPPTEPEYASRYSPSRKSFYYSLCVTFTHKSQYQYNDRNEYETYIFPYSHDAGEKCYKVKTQDN
jgi:hypothetical protein